MILFSNNAASELDLSIGSTDLTVELKAGTGSLFPAITNTGDYFMVTVIDKGTKNFEIMKVVGITGDTLSVQRGQEGTTPSSFAQGSFVENRLTAGSLGSVLNDVIATTTSLGRVKVGPGLSITEDGTLSAVTPEIQPTAEIYVSGPEVGGVIPLSPDKPTQAISIPWNISTGNTRKVFKYTFEDEGTISALSRYRFVLYMDSIETNRDYTFSSTIVATVGGQDILISGNLYTNRFPVTNPRIELPLENNVLVSNVRRNPGDSFEIVVNVTKSGGSPDVANILASPVLDSKLVRNGGEIGSNNVIDFNGVDTATQAERNRYYEQQLKSSGGGKHLGEAYFYLGTDTPPGGLWYNSGATIIDADKLYPDVDGNPGFWSWLTGPKGASLRCTKAQQDAEIATYGVSGRIAVEGTTMYMPTGVPSFFALSGPDKTLMSVEHDTGRKVFGDFSIVQRSTYFLGSGAFSGKSSNTAHSYSPEAYNGTYTASIDSTANWGAEHTSDRFKPVSINARCYIHTASSVIPPSTAQAAEIMSTALQATADAAKATWAGAMSGQYIDFTLPSSGGLYTMPFDGYVAIDKDATAANQYISIGYFGKAAHSVFSVGAHFLNIVSRLVKAGDQVSFMYTAGGTTKVCRAFKAKGVA